MAMAYYSPEDVTILLGGVYKIEGLHEGSFLSISKDEPQYKTYVSTDGHVSRVHVNHPIHTVKITTSSIADVNSVLTTLAATDARTYGAIVPLFIKDTSGTTLFYTPNCWIEQLPEVSLGDEVEAREWVFKAVNASGVVGGDGSGGIVPPAVALAGVIGTDYLGSLI